MRFEFNDGTIITVERGARDYSKTYKSVEMVLTNDPKDINGGKGKAIICMSRKDIKEIKFSLGEGIGEVINL